MNIHVTKRRVIKVLESDRPVLEKYLKVRKLFIPHATKNIKKQVQSVVPILKQIYNDQEARGLIENLDFEKTADFISFLER